MKVNARLDTGTEVVLDLANADKTWVQTERHGKVGWAMIREIDYRSNTVWVVTVNKPGQNEQVSVYSSHAAALGRLSRALIQHGVEAQITRATYYAN